MKTFISKNKSIIIKNQSPFQMISHCSKLDEFLDWSYLPVFIQNSNLDIGWCHSFPKNAQKTLIDTIIENNN